MKKILMTTGAAILALTLVAGAQAYQFNTNLTVGSTGPDVVALQTALIAAGYNIPAVASGAAAKGYFGSQTKTAVMAYQSAHSIPNTGFVGPLTRAALNAGTTATAGGTSTTVASCPAGFTCTPTTPTPVAVTCPVGYTCTPTTPGTAPVEGSTQGITTPGVQGIMSVTQGPVSISSAYAGQTMIPVLDARIQAQYSDLAVQAVQVDLGTSTAIYNYVYSKIYLIDPSTNKVLTSEPLNSSTVVQSSSNYIVGLSGFNFIVPKGTFKDLQIAVDTYPTILTQYLQTWYMGIDANGIRAVDGAGINQYGPLNGGPVTYNGGPSGSVAQAIVVNQNLTLNASANIALDSTSPLVSSIPVTNVTTGQYLGLPVLVFDVNSQGDNLHLHSVSVNINTTGSSSGGSVSAAYLYQGSTPIMSGTVTCTGNNCSASFNNIPDGTTGAGIPINQTVPFTVKVDVNGLTATGSSENVTASTSAMIVYNSADSSVTVNGSAQGNQLSVLGSGLNLSLSGTPTITKTQTSSNSTTGSTTFSYVATFNVVAQAVGQTVTFSLPASATASFGTTSTSKTLAQIYQNQVAVTGNGANPDNTANNFNPALIAAYVAPNNTTTSGNNFTLGINQSVTIPVTYSFTVTDPGANTYSVQLQGVGYNTGSATTTFMSGLTTWRTPTI
ncbi:peptidoglycan-binding protein [Patescibacteria group bacterium]|nr:peptidoglycan-binding protein [Patescibacteria group bacterium]MDE1946402.1 peptidoglycan-binding protein [Patescibacteria group bacterium]MDE2011011.1 peptidoglycan-binding protein [Patescibacteria group bacterium]MDE2233034.1 peptidoglycan-binding protein [Patescibacteria group bacterium]